MIEQVFYKREQEGGWIEAYSTGLSENEGHETILTLERFANYIPKLIGGQDVPHYIFPITEQNRMCIGKFQIERFSGRENKVDQGLMMNTDEYMKLSEMPEKIFGFTNKNFISIKVHRGNKLVSLPEFITERDEKLDVQKIMTKYGFRNAGFCELLSVIYTSLSKGLNYTCGFSSNVARNNLETFKEVGYLIMNMLPYEMRGKIGFGSSGAPSDAGITVQILTRDDATTDVNVLYNIDTQCLSYNQKIEVNNFHLENLLEMTELELKSYFDFVEEFEEQLGLETEGESSYVPKKLVRIYSDPELFSRDNTEEQISFIKDILNLKAKNVQFLKKIAIQLMQYIDASRHMELFDINCNLYLKLDMHSEEDAAMRSSIRENLFKNYGDSTDEEKVVLFRKIYDSEENHSGLYELMECLQNGHNANVTSNLLREYAALLNETCGKDVCESFYNKVFELFKVSGIDGKKKILNAIEENAEGMTKILLLYGFFEERDVAFQKSVIPELISCYNESFGIVRELENRFRERILDVFQEESDSYILLVLNQLKEINKAYDSIWQFGYECINDKKILIKDTDYVENIKFKYYYSENDFFKTLYLDYILNAPIERIEEKIHNIYGGEQTNARDKDLVTDILDTLIEKKVVVSIKILKELVSIANAYGVNENLLAKYIRENYLIYDRDDNAEVYSFLENHYLGIYNCVYLGKEQLVSFDKYYAMKLKIDQVCSKDNLKSTLNEIKDLTYYEFSYTRLVELYKEYIEKESNKCKSDNQRYVLWAKLDGELKTISGYDFYQKYYEIIRGYALSLFWENSNESTFEYDNREIYGKDSLVYNNCYAEHESHKLCEQIEEMFDGKYVIWDSVYKMIFTEQITKNKELRSQIAEGFKKSYKNAHIDKRDMEYIALKHVDTQTLKMNFQALFAEMDKYDYPVNAAAIRGLNLFDYIPFNEKFKSEYRKYKNYHSPYPSYKEVHFGILFGQIVTILILLGSKILQSKAMEMALEDQMRNRWLFLNALILIGVIVIMTVLTVFSLTKLNLRSSTVFDFLMYGLLIANFILITLGVIVTVTIDHVIISCILLILSIVIAIILNILVMARIGSIRKTAVR